MASGAERLSLRCAFIPPRAREGPGGRGARAESLQEERVEEVSRLTCCLLCSRGCGHPPRPLSLNSGDLWWPDRDGPEGGHMERAPFSSSVPPDLRAWASVILTQSDQDHGL